MAEYCSRGPLVRSVRVRLDEFEGAFHLTVTLPNRLTILTTEAALFDDDQKFAVKLGGQPPIAEQT